MDKVSTGDVRDTGLTAQAARPRPGPWRWLLPATLALILVVLTVNVVSHGLLVSLDSHIRSVVLGGARSPRWRWLADSPHAPAQLLTDLGSLLVAIPVLVLAAVAAAAWRHSVRPLITATAGVALLLVSVIPAKIIIGRAGPGLPPVRPGALGVFPSGHTATACVCFSLAAALLTAGQPAWVRRPVLAGLAVLWLAVGAALVWCDYHWFTDVAASWALSALLVPVTLRLVPPAARPGRPAG
jgi:membrane-associated phospholipid phosphatase